MTLQQLSGTEITFWACALAGTTLFILRAVLMLMSGLGGEFHAHSVHVGHAHPAPGVDAHHAATEPAFKLLSLHSLTGFFMIFGWGGLAAYKQFHMGVGMSFVMAFFFGSVALFSVAHLFHAFLRLQSPGDRFDIASAVGKQGSVYARIPADGAGRITVSVDGVQRTLDAVSESGEVIPSFTDVAVIRAVDAKTVSVKKRGQP